MCVQLSIRYEAGRWMLWAGHRQPQIRHCTRSAPTHIVMSDSDKRQPSTYCQPSVIYTVFQLGPFLRALRPARTGLRPARFTRALPELKRKKIEKKKTFNTKYNSDSRCKNACKMLADLCPCFHQSPTRPQDQILVVHQAKTMLSK